MPLAPQEIRTFFVTSVTAGHRAILQTERMSSLLLDVLQDNRKKGRFFLHEFVIMPDHFHLLVTPSGDVSLEKSVQYIKGGFSFRAGKELDFRGAIWQESFAEHRVKDPVDYARHRAYIWRNPVKRALVREAHAFPYSSAYPGAAIDLAPEWLVGDR
ncbi:MAG TPA: transposase [Candidatus Acidoferrales bacterium]|jgi:putative transposase|nr:transposase [Candidatus Acidoferrales bacterium]